MTEVPPVRCDDDSTWRHKGEKIDLPRLLQLIKENRRPDGLDLHGADLSELDASPDAVAGHAPGFGAQRARSPIVTGRSHVGPGPRPPAFSLALSDVHLEWATLEDAQLQNAMLMGSHLEHACLWRADLRGAYLPNARLEEADLRGAQLQGAQLPIAHLDGADARTTRLENAYLFRAQLEKTNLRFAHLQGANLQEAHGRSTRLEGAHLENTDLWDASLTGAFWYSAYLDRTRLRRDGLGRAIGEELAAKGMGGPEPPPIGRWQAGFAHAREAYMALKTNFDSIGRYDDASWAYVKEQQMEKAMYFPTTLGHAWIRKELRRGARRWRKKNPGHLRRFMRASMLGRIRWASVHLRLFLGLCPKDVKKAIGRRGEQGRERDEWLSRWRWARNWAYELLSGYGEWLHMPLIWAAVVIAVFTAIYAGAGNVASGDGGATHSVLTALTHSIAAFATVGFNTLEPVGWGARLLTAIEAMFGIGLFALFVFTLGNRMRRS